MPDIISLADLGVDEDPGTAWHPRPDKDEVWDGDGNLADLDDDTVTAHAAKPEAVDQVDAGVGPMSAEDSAHSPNGEV